MINLEILNPTTELGRAIIKACNNNDYRLVSFEKMIVGSKNWYPKVFTRLSILNNYVGLCGYDLGNSLNDLLHFDNPVEALIKGIGEAVRTAILGKNSWTPWREKLPQIAHEQEVDLPKTIEFLWQNFGKATKEPGLEDLMKCVRYK